MKVAVSGSTGFLGRHVCKKLAEAGVELLHIGRSTERIHKVFGPAQALASDSVAKLEDSLHAANVTAILNLATHFSRGRSPQDIEAVLDANLMASIRLFEASRSIPATFVNFNSFWQLTDADVSSTPYAASKEAFRVYMQMTEVGRAGTISDIFIPETFGPGDTRNKVVQLASQAIANGENFSPKDPYARLDLTYAPLLGDFLKDAWSPGKVLPRKFCYINFPQVHLSSLIAAMGAIYRGQELESCEESLLSASPVVARETYVKQELSVFGVSDLPTLVSSLRSVLAHAGELSSERGSP